MVGSAIWRRLEAAGFTDLRGRSSSEVDLRDRDAVFDYLAEIRPRYVVLAAAKVGGILANNTYPVEFLSDNLRIQTNVLDAALEQRVERLLFLGSSCIYPRLAPQPIREDSLLTGPLEPTNDAYAIAKIAGILGVQAVRRQYGLPWISAMPTNLYGPGDNFSPTGSHVLPALIRRYDEARAAGAADGHQLGHRLARAASSCTSTTSPTPACTCSSTTTGRSRSTSAPARTSRSREIAEPRRRRRRLRGRDRLGHQQARRHAPQAARRRQAPRPRLDGPDLALRRPRLDRRVVPRAGRTAPRGRLALTRQKFTRDDAHPGELHAADRPGTRPQS